MKKNPKYPYFTSEYSCPLCKRSAALVQISEEQDDNYKIWADVVCKCGHDFDPLDITDDFEPDTDSWLEDFYQQQLDEKENKK